MTRTAVAHDHSHGHHHHGPGGHHHHAPPADFSMAFAAGIALNLGFVGHAIRVLRSGDLRNAKRMFGFSLLYLFLHFALLCVDRAPGILPMIRDMLS